MKIAIVDLDQSTLSAKFVSLLGSNESIELIETNLKPAKESVRKGQRLAMLVLDEGFGETAGIFWETPPTIQIGVDPSRAAESAMLQGMIFESIGQLASQRMGDLSSMQDMVKQSREQLASDDSISAGNRLLINAFFSSLEGMTQSIEALANRIQTIPPPVLSATVVLNLPRWSRLMFLGTVDPASARLGR